jgi:hypothetical protein
MGGGPGSKTPRDLPLKAVQNCISGKEYSPRRTTICRMLPKRNTACSEAKSIRGRFAKNTFRSQPFVKTDT